MEDCGRGLSRLSVRVTQRRALGALFSLLGLGFAGVAFAAAYGAGGEIGRWVVVLAAAALAGWLGALAFRALR
jgi:hypothetical protein